MRDTAIGRITFGVFALADMIAASTTFQAKVGAEDAAGAMAHIYRWQLRPAAAATLQSLRPCAVIWQANVLDLAPYAGGSFNMLGGHGGLMLILTDADASARAGRQASGDAFAAFVDGVLNEVTPLAGASDNLDLTGLSLLEPISHSRAWDDAAVGAYWEAVFLAEWGHRR